MSGGDAQSRVREALRLGASPAGDAEIEETRERLTSLVKSDPESPYSQAAAVLLALPAGTKGLPYASRREMASRYLRVRRPSDPYLDADAPLSAKQQSRAMDNLVRYLAERIPPARSQPSQATHFTVNSISRTNVHSDQYIVSDEMNATIEALHDDVSHVMVGLTLFGRDPGAVLERVEPLAGIDDIRALPMMSKELYGIELRLSRTVNAGERTSWHLRVKYEPGTYFTNSNHSRSLRRREWSTFEVCFLGSPRVRARSFVMQGEPNFDPEAAFHESRSDVPLSAYGVASHRFESLEPLWRYGLVWIFE